MIHFLIICCSFSSALSVLFCCRNSNKDGGCNCPWPMATHVSLARRCIILRHSLCPECIPAVLRRSDRITREISLFVFMRVQSYIVCRPTRWQRITYGDARESYILHNRLRSARLGLCDTYLDQRGGSCWCGPRHSLDTLAHFFLCHSLLYFSWRRSLALRR